MNHKEKVAFFDLDYTLIGVNSTKEFLKFVLKENIYSLISFYFYSIIFTLFSLLGIKTGSKKLLFLLKGLSEHEIYDFAKKFVRNVLIKNTNKKVFDKLDNLKLKGYKIIIISSGIQEVVKHFSKHFLIEEYHSSVLSYGEDSICKGCLKINIEGKKPDELKKIKFLKEDSLCYTDNIEDINLRHFVGKLIGVSNNFKEKEFWEKNNIETLELIKKKISYFEVMIPSIYYLKHRTTLKQLILQQGIFLTISIIFFKVNLFYFILFWLAYISFYEIGYFFNDIHSVKFENHARKRIYTPNKNKIYLFTISHLFFGFLPILLLNINNLYVKTFILFNFITLIIFLVHNLIKEGKPRLFSYPFLKLSHFIVPMSFFLNIYELIIISCGLALFYLPKYISSYYYKKVLSKENTSLNKIFLIIQTFILLVIIILFFIIPNFNLTLLFFPAIFLTLEYMNTLKYLKRLIHIN